MALLAGITFLSGCNNEPYVITREEQYAREFIKTFGLIAPGHDWTAAQNTGVTVNTAAPTTVKIYADFNGETYLFGKYDVEAGMHTLNFDIPKGATNYQLKANGKKMAFTPGQSVDLTGTNSRAALGGIEDNLGISGKYAGIDVDIKENEHGRALTLSSITMQEALEILPEKGAGNLSWEETNLGNVTDNFSVNASEFYLFPEYWNTSHSYDNIIGIYWHVDAETEGAEEITVTNADNSTSTYYVVRVPVLQNPSRFMKTCTATTTEVKHFTDIENWDEIFNKLCKKYEGKYKKEIVDGATKYYHIFTRKEDKGWLPLDWTYDADWAEDSGRDWNNEVSREVCKLSMIYSVNNSNGLEKFTGDLTENDLNEKSGCPYSGSTLFYTSYGIHITLSEKKLFGFYIEQDGLVMYSQRKLNDAVTIDGETRQPSYVATYVDDTDTEGNDKRHLCFEDWHYSKGNNWDLNDMVFRVYGFDHINSSNPGDLESPTETLVTDEDKTTSDEGGDEGGDEDDKPFQWIVACEDLGGTDDYDFNDVVFGVEHLSGQREVYVTALAAGGTLETQLLFKLNGEYKEVTGGRMPIEEEKTGFYQYTLGSEKELKEWHKWFGNYPHTSMINTTSYGGHGETVVLMLPDDVKDKFTMANSAQDTNNFGGFSIKVTNDETTTTIQAPQITDNGIVTDNYFPQMFVTTKDYKWPTERTPIYTTHIGDTSKSPLRTITIGDKEYKVYPNSFHDWVQNNNEAFHKQNPTGSVIAHGWTGSGYVTNK